MLLLFTMIFAQQIVQDLKDVMEKRIAMRVKRQDMELDRSKKQLLIPKTNYLPTKSVIQ